MGTKLAETILRDIEDEFDNHRGFRHWWDSIDKDTEQEIRGKLIGIIDENIEREEQPEIIGCETCSKCGKCAGCGYCSCD